MTLRNFDSLNSITTVAVDATTIAVGTSSGKILRFDNKKNFVYKDAYKAHDCMVTDIWLQHNKAIVSTSHDMMINVKSLCNEFDDKKLSIEGYNEEL